MLVPLSWLRDLLPGLPADGREVGTALLRVGLEVEHVRAVGTGLDGIVAGRVESIEELSGYRRPVRWCQVDVGEDTPRGVICGAANFGVGAAVAVALPGAVLADGTRIGSRRAYDHLSDGMICSARELGLGTDHTGILTLGAGEPAGTDLSALLADEVLDIAVTPDRGYCLSVRGIAREAAAALDLEFADPARPEPWPSKSDARGYPVEVADPAGCPLFVGLSVDGIDPAASSPPWLVLRLLLAGMRAHSVVVDVTNAVMLELGQPLHAYDRAALTGPVGVRRARPGERLVTLDGVARALDVTDLLITDDSGPIGLAGVMGGEHTEVGPATTSVLVEAAHFDPVSVARTARRHRLGSEASRRFERFVDSALPFAAARRVGELLTAHAGGTVGAATVVGGPLVPAEVRMPVDHPGRVAGRSYPPASVRRRLEQVGCVVSGDGALTVGPPTWRPDLTLPNDLAEEVLRLEGYDTIPVRVPTAPAGRGRTLAQRRRLSVARALADAGYTEVTTVPFSGPDPLGLPPDDPRQKAVRIANPIAADQAWLRSTLLPGLLIALARNVGRGQRDLALFELGTVVRAHPAGSIPRVASPRVDRRPNPEEIAALDAALPPQFEYAAVVLAGARQPPGWWGAGRPADWADAVEAAGRIAACCGVDLAVRAAEVPPWHPGRCAALAVDGAVVGHAGELAPAVCSTFDLPERTCAMELDLGALLGAPASVPAAPDVSAFPPAVVDVALVVTGGVAARDVEEALSAGAGGLLESAALFDVYTGPPVPPGARSLAYTLTFRAPDRTLTGEEANAARDAAVAEAARRTGASLRA